MRQCPNCNAQIDENNKFCIFCGTKLTDPNIEQPMVAPQPIQEPVPMMTPVEPQPVQQYQQPMVAPQPIPVQQQYPQQPVVQPMQQPMAAQQPALQYQPQQLQPAKKPISDGVSRGIIIIFLALVAMSPFPNFFEAGTGPLTDYFSSYKLVKQAFSIADVMNRFFKADEAVFGLVAMSFVVTLFYLMGFAGLIGSIFLAGGQGKKGLKFWKSAADGFLSVFLANSLTALLVLSLEEKTREAIDLTAITGKAFRVNSFLWVLIGFSFLMFICCKYYQRQWKKYLANS